MSTWYRAIEFKCVCGVDYGSCDRISKMVLKCNASCDVYHIFVRHSPDDPYTELGNCFNDNSLIALKELINGEDGVMSASLEDIKEISKL